MILLAGLVVCAASRTDARQQSEAFLPDNVAEGWRIFVDKQCFQCHAVWGVGGTIGPDLGRTEQQGFTAGELAGTLWNHIPKVHAHVQRQQLRYPRLTESEMSDLYSFLFHVRYLDEPGDPEAGRTVLREKGCASCHSTEAPIDSAAPDLKEWSGYANPIVWAQKMWEHAPMMEEAMREAGISWPHLDDTDLMNMIAYLRSIGGHDAKVYLEPGSPRLGARLFADRQCLKCHHAGGPGPDLASAPPPRSLAALASQMWNHSPEMTQTMQTLGLDRSPLSAQEMADIIAYIISLRYRDRGGDATEGRMIFGEKRCAECHTVIPSEDATAPALKSLATIAQPVRLAPAMWNHGIAMMDQFSGTGDIWPTFGPGEMLDLIAYLQSVAPPAPARPARPPPAVASAQPLERLLLGGPPVEPDTTCATNVCHPGVIAERVVHAPAAQGDCAACHVLVDPASHLFRMRAEDSRLCSHCHDAKTETPVPSSICTICHDPHSADNLLGPGFTGGEACFDDILHLSTALETLLQPAAAPAGITEPEPRPTDEVVEVATGEAASLPPGPGGTGDLTPIMSDLIPTSPETCVTAACHASIIAERHQHGPTAQQQCDVCHVVTDAQEHQFQLLAPEPDLCYTCHEPVQDLEYQHGPVGLGLCSPCHDPHSDAEQFMLPALGSDLCFMCHTDMAEHVEACEIQHAAVHEEGCVACHDAHQSDHKYQLTDEPFDLCLRCHGEIGEIVANAVIPHDPVTTGATCIACHNAHGSDVPGILIDVEMKLCLDCHDEPMDTPHGSIVDMKSWIVENPEHHGPIRDGNCSSCHQPHGSQNFRILQHEFPRRFYSPFSIDAYALCFECHEESIVLDERTTTLTEFRNGDKNLHFIHVNQDKGRSCRACHEVHAGTKPKRIKDFVPFGTWALPINFEITEHGGRCAPGCHQTRAYDRRHEIAQD